MKNYEIVLKLLNELHPNVDFESSANLIEDNLIDSFDLVMLTASLEDAFNVSIPGDQIAPENFISVAAINNLIIRLQS